MNEQGLTKNQVIATLSKSPHGALKEYVPIGQAAAKQEAEFFGHFVAWNARNGQIRDSKVALPVVNLSVGPVHPEFRDNALAHMARLDPRNFLRALRFSKELKTPGYGMSVRRLVGQYLRSKESNWAKWEHAAVQHRASMKELYALYSVKPSSMADAILFKSERPHGSIFEAIATLKSMSPLEAAGTILERRIPFLIAIGALGEKAKSPELVLALIERMSSAELLNNTKLLERLGMKDNAALRGAYSAALTKASTSKKVATLKATSAADAIEDEDLKARLKDVQQKQIQANSSVEGNWLVLGDKSGSMSAAIEMSRHVAATLAAMVKGSVHLVFFDTAPRYLNVTGKTYDEIVGLSRHVVANGGTSIGCGLQHILDKNIDVDGIAIVSDGGDHSPPWFHTAYRAYAARTGKEVPIYLYRTDGEGDYFSSTMKKEGIDVQKFDLTGKVDYYSLPNLVKTMRVSRFSLIDEIMETPLLSLEDIFSGKEKEELVYA